MRRTVYLNGAFLPEDQAQIAMFDRGFLMGDAVYEVTTVIEGKLIEFPAHMARLARSLGEVEIPFAMDQDALLTLHRDLIAANQLHNGTIYLQVSRGPADRDFAYPAAPKPTVIAFIHAVDWLTLPVVTRGFRVITRPEGRWCRRDIKTTQLLRTSMSKMEALRQGKDDVWFIEDGHITEGASSNAFIVKDGCLISPALSPAILHGVTRAVILRIARATGLRVEERPFTLAEALSAEEVFITASPVFAAAVVEIDSTPIGTGTPGPITQALRAEHIRQSLAEAL